MDKFIYPVPANSRISQFFNERPSFYRDYGFKGHPGVDFAVPVGTLIISTFYGEVCEMGWSQKGWGIYLKIKHDGVISLYAHLSRIKVFRGCHITKGQLIAYSGNTGLSSGPHLHFGIQDLKKINNGYKGYIDPMPYLKKIRKSPTGKLEKIQAEVNQIEKDGYTKKSMFIHTKYIERIIKGG